MLTEFSSAASPRKVIVACMRNEALFVVEWVAHHLAIGFDHIVVYSNDCDDGTDAILDLLAESGRVSHFDNPGPYPAGSIQKQALERAYALKLVKQADWVLHIDADEYVNVVVGQRKIDDLIALHPEADAIALMWRHFGSAGKKTWEGGSVVESFIRCEGKLPDVENGELANFKTLFRPSRFRMMGVHTPKLPRKKHVPVVVNAAGVLLPNDKLLTKAGSGYAATAAQLTWDNALLHHHHVKSDDLHVMKHARGDANGRKNAKRVIGSDFYRYADRNDVFSKSLVRFRPKVVPWEAKLRAIPGVIAAEAQAWAWFRANFAAIAQEQAG